jgi:hypothetical protein
MAGSTRGGSRRPGTYEYDRAARDALAFAALFDRFIQNLRRYLGSDVLIARYHLTPPPGA